MNIYVSHDEQYTSIANIDDNTSSIHVAAITFPYNNMAERNNTNEENTTSRAV